MRKVEEAFRLADAVVEKEIEPNLIDSDSDDDLGIDEDVHDEDDNDI